MNRSILILIAALAASQPCALAGEIYGRDMDRELISLFQKKAVDFYKEGRYPEAVKAASAALDFAETVYGPGNAELAGPYTTLALAHQAKGDYARALKAHRRALRIRLASPGQEAAAADSLSFMALAYQALGRAAAAEKLSRQALALRESRLGAGHPALAPVLNNLAGICRSQGRFEEAKALYARAYGILEAAGSAEGYRAKYLNNMAVLYQSTRDYDKALEYAEAALELREATYGEDHPRTAVALNNLAGLYRLLGRYENAEPLYLRAIGIWKASLGPAHPNVMKALNNLGFLYQAQGKFAEAEPLYREALGIARSNDPVLPVVRENLASLCRETACSEPRA